MNVDFVVSRTALEAYVVHSVRQRFFEGAINLSGIIDYPPDIAVSRTVPVVVHALREMRASVIQEFGARVQAPEIQVVPSVDGGSPTRATLSGASRSFRLRVDVEVALMPLSVLMLGGVPPETAAYVIDLRFALSCTVVVEGNRVVLRVTPADGEWWQLRHHVPRSYRQETYWGASQIRSFLAQAPEAADGLIRTMEGLRSSVSVQVPIDTGLVLAMLQPPGTFRVWNAGLAFRTGNETVRVRLEIRRTAEAGTAVASNQIVEWRRFYEEGSPARLSAGRQWGLDIDHEFFRELVIRTMRRSADGRDGRPEFDEGAPIDVAYAGGSLHVTCTLRVPNVCAGVHIRARTTVRITPSVPSEGLLRLGLRISPVVYAGDATACAIWAAWYGASIGAVLGGFAASLAGFVGGVIMGVVFAAFATTAFIVNASLAPGETSAIELQMGLDFGGVALNVTNAEFTQTRLAIQGVMRFPAVVAPSVSLEVPGGWGWAQRGACPHPIAEPAFRVRVINRRSATDPGVASLVILGATVVVRTTGPSLDLRLEVVPPFPRSLRPGFPSMVEVNVRRGGGVPALRSRATSPLLLPSAQYFLVLSTTAGSRGRTDCACRRAVRRRRAGHGYSLRTSLSRHVCTLRRRSTARRAARKPV